jgi:dipeptidase E
MRLFLSSQDFGNYADKAFELAGNNKKAAFIKNAQDDKPSEERNFSTPQKKLMFEQAGFSFEELDLREYFGKSEELKAKLEDFGSVWFAGGNSFILRRAMRDSGLDGFIVDWLKEDRILYGGYSAGAIVATTTLHGSEIGDRPRPDVVPENYLTKETIWEGLGLVPFSIVPHVESDWFGDKARTAIEYFEANHLPYNALKDGQVIVIDGDKEELLQ